MYEEELGSDNLSANFPLGRAGGTDSKSSRTGSRTEACKRGSRTPRKRAPSSWSSQSCSSQAGSWSNEEPGAASKKPFFFSLKIGIGKDSRKFSLHSRLCQMKKYIETQKYLRYCLDSPLLCKIKINLWICGRLKDDHHLSDRQHSRHSLSNSLKLIQLRTRVASFCSLLGSLFSEAGLFWSLMVVVRSCWHGFIGVFLLLFLSRSQYLQCLLTFCFRLLLIQDFCVNNQERHENRRNDFSTINAL